MAKMTNHVSSNLSNEEIKNLRSLFPILERKVHDKDLVYFDNAATTLKPKPVVDAIIQYYTQETANVHRGLHYLSEVSTTKYENARDKLKDLINARSRKEIIFTTGTTEGINLVARTYGEKNLKPGDEILVGGSEHHSNIVPWQMLCEKTGATLKHIPLDDLGDWDLSTIDTLINSKTKLISVNHISNSLGTQNPIELIISKAKAVGAITLIDMAQSIAHQKIDVQSLGADLVVFSAHKMYGPTGVGALYGREDLLETFPPFHGGGDMIDKVSFEKTTFNDLPYRLEAGTPNIAGIIGFGASVDFLNSLNLEKIRAYEDELLEYATEKLSQIPRLTVIGRAKKKANVLSFVIEGIHPQDLAPYIDRQGIAIRTGHHCTQPVMEHFNVAATARASFAFYNTKEEVDKLKSALESLIELYFEE